MKREFGLLGFELKHSFSKAYFEKKFAQLNFPDYSYNNFEIKSVLEFREILKAHPLLSGLNVTLPYKESIITLLDELDAEAEAIGAVNCIQIAGGKTKGFNTDVYGFSQSIKPFLDHHHERALILGTGGAARAVNFALKRLGVETAFLTSQASKRKPGVFLYTEANERMLQAYKLVVNASPLGMYPKVEQCPDLPYQYFGPEHLAFDLVYNPEETLFLKKARASGATGLNGLSMLHLQAEKSWEIWNNT
ncbi:MAG TPA: shikimate dehydrogenase [Bacteroidia bacterium]|nr:shikimate dehydrogenase [Bacteroidia bacterium]